MSPITELAITTTYLTAANIVRVHAFGETPQTTELLEKIAQRIEGCATRTQTDTAQDGEGL